MKKLNLFFILILLVFGCAQNEPSHEEQHEHHMHEVTKTYTCPMHPEIVRNEPGQCPICGMKLVEKAETTGQEEDLPRQDEKLPGNRLEMLFQPTNGAVLSEAGTTFPKQKDMLQKAEVSGIITYDTKQISVISARVTGRINKLYVKYRYQPVSKGQKLMEIYSEELVTDEENYLYLLKMDPENTSLIAASENRLLLQGCTKEQIEELKRNRKVFQSLTFLSPYSGHLHDFSDQNIRSMPMTTSGSEEISLKEGMYVQKGQTVFNIYGTEKVWAVLNVFSDEKDMVKHGSKVTLSVNGVEENIVGQVDFVEPILREGFQSISVRISLDNKRNNFKIGSLVKAKIISESRKGLFIPASAIVHLGSRDVVFKREGKLFRAKEVDRGKSLGGEVEILSGLTRDDEIALNAQMLIDSESFIRVNK